jgi:hypothetical protein
MKKRDFTLWVIFSIISFFYIVMIVDLIISGHPIDLFWTCYIAIPLILFGLIKKNSNLILSQVIILGLNDLVWIFDFACLIILGHTVIGINQVVFFPIQTWIEKLGNIQHLFIVPLSLVALSILKIKRSYKIWLFSFIEMSVFFIATLLFVPPEETANCVHQTCINIPLNFLPYPVIWFLFTFGFIAASYFIITSFPIFRKRKIKGD